ncbi:unnamed protein product, partial [Iphiclides podalirius]
MERWTAINPELETKNESPSRGAAHYDPCAVSAAANAGAIRGQAKLADAYREHTGPPDWPIDSTPLGTTAHTRTDSRGYRRFTYVYDPKPPSIGPPSQELCCSAEFEIELPYAFVGSRCQRDTEKFLITLTVLLSGVKTALNCGALTGTLFLSALCALFASPIAGDVCGFGTLKDAL